MPSVLLIQWGKPPPHPLRRHAPNRWSVYSAPNLSHPTAAYRVVDLVHFEGMYLVHRLSARVVSEAGVLDLVRLLKVDLVQ